MSQPPSIDASPPDGGSGTLARPALRSYGRRCGRALRRNRRDNLRVILPQVALSLPAEGSVLDPGTTFAQPVAAVWLEIGFGAGEHLLGRAAQAPEVGLIGCEPYLNGVTALLARLDAPLRDRVRVFPDDARPLLDRLAPASIARVFVLFPDPWPKRRHRQRRLVNRELLDSLARVLVPAGEWLFASDDAAYAASTLALAISHPAFDWTARTAADWRLPPAGWIDTRYQRKAEARGATCVYLRFCRSLPPPRP